MRENYMRLAMELALKGGNRVSPNPLVGAVIVKDGEIIGQGYHEEYGGPHAEINALRSVDSSPTGATMYVTLEPCCHHGKTPPCTEALIRSGISRVVVGAKDPNPLVAGRGMEILRESGISVEMSELESECEALNRIFFHYIRTGTPYVVMKYAMTLDGKTATVSGRSRWISGEVSRENVHRTRNMLTAIMTGSGTVIADDPELTCRIEGGRDPIRIICDSRLRIPLDAKVFRNTDRIRTIVATCTKDRLRIENLENAGCRVIRVKERDGHLDLNMLMKKLGEEKIDSILLEGGSTLNAAALESGIVSSVQAYIAPKIFGGEDAKGPVGGIGVFSPEMAYMMKNMKITLMDDDILLEYEVERCLQE